MSSFGLPTVIHTSLGVDATAFGSVPRGNVVWPEEPAELTVMFASVIGI
jgi:hypothetical protein